MDTSTLTIKVISRSSYPWGIFDEEKKEFIKMYQTKTEAKAALTEMLEPKKSQKRGK